MARAREPAMNARCQKARKKRPLTAYNLFLSKFMRSQCIASVEDAQKALKAGAKLWSKMSCSEKRKYGRQQPKMWSEYRVAMANYRAQLQTFKAPPRPFAAFLKDYYYSGRFVTRLEGETGRDIISRLSKSASSAWHHLQPSQRYEYTSNFQAQYREHKRSLSGSDELSINDITGKSLQLLGPGQKSPDFSPETELESPEIQLEASTVCNSNTRPKPILRKFSKFGRRGRGASKKTLRFSEDNQHLG
ncbi:unnamed protein product [Allacma fusca]|uniref:HMG box domain-containing protein n=1 Tax=Allacma fusca TaxID=39272 RepID=A0A8J2KEP1_9HEXA|nr:unnamed protein product [Allacma fusca]